MTNEIDDLAFNMTPLKRFFPADVELPIHENTGRVKKTNIGWLFIKLKIFTKVHLGMIKKYNFVLERKKALQSPITFMCGAWCLFYIFLKCQGRHIRVLKQTPCLMGNNLFLQENKLYINCTFCKH